MKAWRIVLATGGVMLAALGGFLLIEELTWRGLAALGGWLLAALVIHDALVAPSVVGVGWLLRAHVPDRGRRYVQVALIVGGLVTVIALPMIYLRGSQPAVKALLLRDYSANLGLIVGAVAAVTLALYSLRVARDRAQRGPRGP